MMDIVNSYATEHLIVSLDNAEDFADRVTSAGSIFIGNYTPGSAGDYASGTNHTLPTSGTARFSSPLSVDDFVKKSSFTYYTEEALKKEAKKIDVFANREGLQAHGKSATLRLEKEER